MEPSKFNQLLNIRCFNVNNSRECIDEIVSALRSHDLQLLTLVEKLGQLLSSEDKGHRNIGLTLLVQVLEDVGHEMFSSQEITSLLAFFCSRLSDHHSLLPVTLQGIVFLSRSPDLKENEVQTIVKSLFSEVNAAAQLQEERRKLYSIFSNLLDNHLSSLQVMGSEFLLSYIQTMDGERDPCCLMIAFRIVTILAKNFELGDHVEDLFEVVACYFPVNFRAPTEDRFGISSEELMEALEECLASTNLFAQFCLPLLLEKLSSNVDSAKLDALHALERCASSYGSLGLKSNLKNIWSAIRKEVYSGNDDEVSSTSIKCLTVVVSSLSEDDSASFLESVWRECSQVIRGDSELSVISAMILQAAVSGSSTYLRNVFLDRMLPHMTQVIKETDGTQRLSHFQAFSLLLDIPSVDKPAMWNCCEDCWTLLISHLSPEDNSVYAQNVTSCCWLAVQRLLSLGAILPQLEVIPLVHRILSQVVNKSSIYTTKSALFEICSSLCKVYPEISTSHLVPGLLECVSYDGIVDEILVAVCTSSPSFTQLIISDSLMITFTGNHSHELALSKCLEALVHCKEDNHENLWETYLVPLLGTSLLDVYEQKLHILNRPLYSAIEALVAALDPKTALEASNRLLQVVIFNEAWEIWRDVTPKNFECLPRPSQSALCQLLCSVLPHLALSSDPCPFENTMQWLISKSDLGVDIAKTLSSLANKCTHCGQIAFESIRRAQMNRDVILSLLWLTKGMLLSNHPSTDEATKMLLSLLGDHNYGNQVAKEFEIILSPADNVLKPNSHARIVLFHSQRFFWLTSADLLELYQDTENETRRNYLYALCCQLKYLPLPVLKQELPKLLPVLVATLEQRKENGDQDLLLSSVDALSLLLASENANMVSLHLSTLIPRLTEHARHNSLKMRIGALKCLYEFANLPTELTLLHCSDVLQALKCCLDDKKRLVRKEASRTASRWHLVGMEVSEEIVF